MSLPFDPERVEGLKKLVVFQNGFGENGVHGKNTSSGYVAVFDSKNHEMKMEEYLGDYFSVGCGVLLARFEKPIKYLEKTARNILDYFEQGRSTRRLIGTMGGGIHYITFYKISEAQDSEFAVGEHLVLIHCGPRKLSETGVHKTITGNAKRNRKVLLDLVQEKAGQKAKLLFDKIHNSIESEAENITYRRGVVKIRPGELTIIPSSMADDAVLVRARDEVSELSDSLPQATGRVFTGRDREELYFLDGKPGNIYFPLSMDIEHYNSQLPQNFRKLEDVLPQLGKYIEIKAVLKPTATVIE